jgi:hypothetical protein
LLADCVDKNITRSLLFSKSGDKDNDKISAVELQGQGIFIV